MLFARAISRGARRFAPGIFGGAPVYTPDEMGVDTDEEGFIEGESITIEEPDEQNIKSEQEKSEPKSSDTTSNEPITIEKSCAMLDSEGTKYGDLPTDKLSYKFNAITKKLSDDIDDEARSEYEIKQQAIKLILKARADGSIQ
jgi:hypothetical protein